MQEINPNNWDLKYGRVEGKSATALSINQKLDNNYQEIIMNPNIRQYISDNNL